MVKDKETSLNPFGTGQCLTTGGLALVELAVTRLNPFGTGRCLTTQEVERYALDHP